MSQENNETDVTKATSGGQPSPEASGDEASGEQAQREIQLEVSSFHAEEPKAEPPGDNGVLPEASTPKGFEEEAGGGKDDATPPARGVSDRKLAANRENAKRSTGPKTTEGKATSAQNSYKHGIFSATLIREGESEKHDRAVFEEVVDAIGAYYKPVGFIEELLVEKITTETIRFRRLLSFEQQELGRKNAFWFQGVDRVLRYQATINRQLFQAMEQLEHLQAERKEQSVSNDKPTNAEAGEGEDRPDREEEKR